MVIIMKIENKLGKKSRVSKAKASKQFNPISFKNIKGRAIIFINYLNSVVELQKRKRIFLTVRSKMKIFVWWAAYGGLMLYIGMIIHIKIGDLSWFICGFIKQSTHTHTPNSNVKITFIFINYFLW